MNTAESLLYYEDLSVGYVFRTDTLEVTKEEIVAFASRYDPQPFHIDEEAGRKSIFGGLVSSGWLTGSLTMRLLVLASGRFGSGLVGLGFDSIVWPKPVRPGDQITAESEILSMRTSASRPTHGLLKCRITTFNQNGETVQILVVNQLVGRRPVSA